MVVGLFDIFGEGSWVGELFVVGAFSMRRVVFLIKGSRLVGEGVVNFWIVRDFGILIFG